MKKLFLLGAFFLGILMVQGQNAFADAPSAPPSARYDACGSCCPQQCCDTPCGEDRWVKYCRNVPYTYYTTKCEYYQVPYCVRCCRMVPQHYQVKKCRYVPEYYCVDCCRYVPEYYSVQKCRTCKRFYSVPNCAYRTCYYWKHETPCCNNYCSPCNGGYQNGGMDYRGDQQRPPRFERPENAPEKTQK